MGLNSYITYHIDPRAFREKGVQNKLDEPIEVIPTEEDRESVLKRLSAPFTAPPKPTKAELEMLIHEGLNANQIADRCQVSLIRVRNWFKHYQINFKKITA